MTPSVITLLTDFGLKDYYIGVMKGVILSINPQVKIIDISHGVTPHNVVEGAITLSNYYSYFPPGTIHVAVVDPGVGTERKPILVYGKNYFFVGPDNGIFGLIYGVLEEFEVFELTNSRFFIEPVSLTFHGRDIFAPVAAYLSRGVSPSEMGQKINRYEVLSIPAPTLEGKRIKGKILYIDGFGNLVTNINRIHMGKIEKENCLKVKIGRKVIQGISKNYHEVEKGEVIALIGSSDSLEISVREGNAKKMLRATEGDEVLIFV